MCRPSNAVGLLILYHYLTSWCNCPRAFFSQDTFNCLCSSLSHRHNPVLHPPPAPPRPPKGWRISFMLALRVGFTQIFFFFSYRWALAKAKAFSGPSPILKVSQLHWFSSSAKLFHRSFTQQRGRQARDNTCSNLLHFHSVKIQPRLRLLHTQTLGSRSSNIRTVLVFCLTLHVSSVTINVDRQIFLFVFLCSFLFSQWKVPHSLWTKKTPLTLSCLSHLQVIEFDDGSGSVLRIQPLRTPRDEAIYECVASNSVGEISATTRLTVLRGTCLSTTPEKPQKKNIK